MRGACLQVNHAMQRKTVNLSKQQIWLSSEEQQRYYRLYSRDSVEVGILKQ
jgi:hypothetical protein